MTANPGANPGPSPINTPQPGEQFFRQSIADLSKRLGERAARQSTSEPQTAAEARRRAMQAYERERTRKLRLMLMGAAVVVVTAGIAWTVVMLGRPEVPASAAARPIANAQPDSQVVMASAPPAAAPVPAEPPQAEQPPPAPPAVEAQPPAPPAPVQQAAAASDPAPAPTPPAPPLNRAEIREVQKRLLAFGFDPGPIDGVPGRQTQIATQHYLEARGEPQMPPTEPQLLENLRQDPAPTVAPPSPKIAQRATQSDGYGARAAQQRRSFDPFQPVKLAGAEITRWLQSAFR